MKGYFSLSIAIIAEIFATTMLKMSDGFTNILPSVCVVIGYGLSFYLLSLCLKSIPLSLAYAIWSGVGTAVIAFIGVLIWDEVLTTLKIIGMILIIGGVVMLNTSQHGESEKESLS